MSEMDQLKKWYEREYKEIFSPDILMQYNVMLAWGQYLKDKSSEDNQTQVLHEIYGYQ